MLSVLIASQSENIRNTLKNQLSQDGSFITLQAATFAEAEQILTAKGSQISFIVSDFDCNLPGVDRFANYVEKFSEFDSIPFLKTEIVQTFSIKSSLNSRIDAYIAKPFKHTALKEALSRASVNLLRKKSTLICFEGNVKLNQTLLRITANEKYHWQTLITVKTFADFQAAIESNARTLGGLLIDPSVVSKIPHGWLNIFQKSRLGSQIAYVCLSRDPLQVRSLRTNCQFFWNEFGSETELSMLSERVLYRFEFKMLHEIVHFKTSKKPLKEHLNRITKLIQHNHAESLCLLGETNESNGKLAQARENYIRAIEANPCNPRPYIKIFPLLFETDRAKLHQYIKLAMDYCPRSPEIIKHASRFQSLNTAT